MKPRTRKTLLTLMAVLILAALAVISFYPSSLQPEPSYDGNTVDEWLEPMASRSSTEGYDNALRHFGGAAVPFIFRKLEQNDSPAANKYRDLWPKLPSFLRNHLPKPTSGKFSSTSAGWALRMCGPDAVPGILKRINDGNPAVREAAWDALSPLFYLDRSLRAQGISLSKPALHDADASVCEMAVLLLGQIGPSASNTVPDLIPLLTRDEAMRGYPGRAMIQANTALTLGRIGPAAIAAVPALTNLMARGDSYSKVSAAVALWHITSNENLMLPVLLKELPVFDRHIQKIPVDALREMGPHAKPAFQLLTQEFNRPPDTQYPQYQEAKMAAQRKADISNALIAIDPEAAAKFFAAKINFPAPNPDF